MGLKEVYVRRKKLIKISPGFFNLSPFLGKLVLNSYSYLILINFFLLTYLYFLEPQILNLNLSS